MKRRILLFGLLLFFGSTYGKQIEESTAKRVGQNFIAGISNSPSLGTAQKLELIYKAHSVMNNVSPSSPPMTFFYVFNAGTSGFVIVAGDDNVTPILAYSDQGTFDPGNMPQNVAKWLEGYKSEIRYVIDNDIKASLDITDQWNMYKSVSTFSSADYTSATVNPLMQTQWNQSPYYNDLCPGGSVTGCVATAMAQIMKYWNYPATGSGFHSYNHPTYGTLSASFSSSTYQWTSMPNTLSSANNAIATLMYDVGVSVDMNYSPQVSGAYVITAQSPVTNCSEYALETYFGYKNTLQGIERANYSESQWLALLKSELDASRPILYAGFGTGGGHCFVADGYDINDYIHFNWGWGGAYDGFFHINALDPSGTGTGGGTGGYNSGHQAVIGIEPPTGTQSYSMALYDYVTPSLSTIYYGQAFSVSTNIVNNGTATFNGDFTVAVFDADYNFIDYVETLTGYTLQGSYAYTNNLVFSTTGLFSMLPGTYYVGVYHRPTGGNWFEVSNNASYTNMVQMTVINPNDIELNSAMTVSPGTTLTEGQAASVNLNIVNDGTATFFGEYGVGLYNLDGSFAQTIGTINETNGLQSGYTYLSPFLTFNTASVAVSPGTYLLAVQHNPNGSGWQLTGSSYFQNPIKVTVIASGIQADMYEVNDAIGQSYDLPISFTGNGASKNTIGSNCHLTSDNDFYKIVLPAGYNYAITPRIHDSYNSGNGNIYSLDGLFSYSTDGTTWSDAFDDIITGSITLNGGGTVYFHVAPYFAGETGTYLLDMTLTRTAVIGIEENEMEKLVSIYPNPAKDYITIDLNEIKFDIDQINLLTIQGQQVFSEKPENEKHLFHLNLKGLADGLYFLQLRTSHGMLEKKLIISK
ncbi:MAG: thiol protease/hemagglutinin PrtT [Bacteroidia bacterium]|nr:thiol protease/hemagglutinin PrtT [Bacteroidia bacterium]